MYLEKDVLHTEYNTTTHSTSRNVVFRSIRGFVHSGKKQKQAVAIALSVAGKMKDKMPVAKKKKEE